MSVDGLAPDPHRQALRSAKLLHVISQGMSAQSQRPQLQEKLSYTSQTTVVSILVPPIKSLP